jgi:transcriptional regulator with XRE-family HTH domain
MEKENYGTLVKNLRIQNNLTQNQVAEALGVTPGYISNVENNRTAMSLRMLTYYARLVGCSLDSLVGELEPEYSETALDRELYETILKLDTDTKEKLLKTLQVWQPLSDNML